MRLRSLVCPEPDGAGMLSGSVGTDLVRSQRREQEQKIAAFCFFLPCLESLCVIFRPVCRDIPSSQ